MVESVPDAETNISSTFPSLELKTPESWFGGMYNFGTQNAGTPETFQARFRPV